MAHNSLPDRVETAADRLAETFLADGLPPTPEVFRLQMRAAAFAGAAARLAEMPTFTKPDLS